MGDVITLSPKVEPETTEIHASGHAKCLACKHRWVAVAQLPLAEFECPECGCEKGVFIGTHIPMKDHAVWTCDCGCDLLRLGVRPDGSEYLLCITCGHAQTCVT